MTIGNVVKKLRSQLKRAEVSEKAADRIIKKVKEDTALPYFLVKTKTLRVNVNNDGFEIHVYVGPRDWIFSSKGSFWSAATSLL